MYQKCWCLPPRFEFGVWPHGSLSFIRLVRLLLLLVLELQRWPGVFIWIVASIERRLPCIIMEEQEAVVSLVLSGHNVFFQEGRRQSLGKSVVMRTLRNARSIAADDDGKLLPQRFTTATGLARGSATLIARQVLANDEASEPTIGLGRRGCRWWTGPSAKCSWCALHVLRRLDFIARVARDRCVPFGDKQIVFAGDFFSISSCPQRRR